MNNGNESSVAKWSFIVVKLTIVLGGYFGYLSGHLVRVLPTSKSNVR